MFCAMLYILQWTSVTKPPALSCLLTGFWCNTVQICCCCCCEHKVWNLDRFSPLSFKKVFPAHISLFTQRLKVFLYFPISNALHFPSAFFVVVVEVVVVVVAVAVTGGWSEWTPWTECAANGGQRCGSGFQKRERFCNRPSPKWGGDYCKGQPFQKNKCTMHCKGTLISLQCSPA